MSDRGHPKINARAPKTLHDAIARCARDHRETKSDLILGGVKMLLEDRGYWSEDDNGAACPMPAGEEGR